MEKIPVLSRYLVQKRNSPLVQALYILKYLDQQNKNELNFDLAYHNIEDPSLVQAWMEAINEMYTDIIKDLPPNSPLYRCNPVEVNCFLIVTTSYIRLLEYHKMEYYYI